MTRSERLEREQQGQREQREYREQKEKDKYRGRVLCFYLVLLISLCSSSLPLAHSLPLNLTRQQGIRTQIFLEGSEITSSSLISLSSSTSSSSLSSSGSSSSSLSSSSSTSTSLSSSLSSVCIFTISAWNNFGFVQAFFDAVIHSNPQITCRIWVVADKPEYPEIIQQTLQTDKDKFHVVTVDELATISPFSVHDLAFKFDLVEFSTTIKPLAFLYLFQVLNAKQAIYFDNDVWLTNPLTDLITLLQTKLVVVTPHVSVPIPEDGKHQRDINILKAGVLNFGFVSFSAHAKTIQFLDWWYERLRYYGYVLLEKGMHFDQNWGHFIFVFFNSDEFFVIRDPRYNIAYWNLHYTGADLHLEKGIPYLGDTPVIFMHFSGVSLFEEYDLNTISRHQNRYTLQHFPQLESVLQRYISHVTSFNVEKFRKIPYGYNYFSDETLIPAIIKQYYIQINDVVNIFEPYSLGVRTEAQLYFQSLKITNPFYVTEWFPYKPTSHPLPQSQPNSFLEYLLGGPYNFIVNCEGAQYFSEIEHLIYRQRSDLQQVFPDPFGANFWDFKHWFSASVSSEYNIGGSLLEMWRRNVNKASRIAKLGPTKEKNFGVTVVGWHHGMFGVGISASMIFKNLLSVKGNVDAMILYGASAHKHTQDRIPEEYLTRSATKPINIFVANADNTPLLHEVYPLPLWRRHYNIGVWAWELELFPADWMKYLSHFDEIWVPSTFVQKSILLSPLYSKYPTPVHVFPFGYSKKTDEIDSVVFTRSIKKTIADVIIPRDTFLFFLVFDYYSVFDRKNPLGAVRAFKEAFPHAESHDVIMVIKSSKPDRLFKTERNKLLDAIGQDSRIHLVEKVLSDGDMKSFFQRTDCYVSLHRSEGFGINILEAMLAGIPTIATDYGGNVDFFNADNIVRSAHFPVSFDLIPVDSTAEYSPYKIAPDAKWAQPNHEEAVSAMKSVVTRQIDPSIRSSAAEKLRSFFGDTEVGIKMMNRLKNVNWMSKVTGEGLKKHENENQKNTQNENLPANGIDRAVRLHKRVTGMVKPPPNFRKRQRI